MKFNNVEITKDSFNSAKRYYIYLSYELIKQVDSGELFVNDKSKYIKDKLDYIQYLENLKTTSNFTLLQRAYYIQTGEMIPLLGKDDLERNVTSQQSIDR